MTRRFRRGSTTRGCHGTWRPSYSRRSPRSRASGTRRPKRWRLTWRTTWRIGRSWRGGAACPSGRGGGGGGSPRARGVWGAASGVAALALVGIVVGWIENARVRASERSALAARSAEAQERKKAEAAAEREQRLGYIHQIVLAEREWSGNNTLSAERLLDE